MPSERPSREQLIALAKSDPEAIADLVLKLWDRVDALEARVRELERRRGQGDGVNTSVTLLGQYIGNHFVSVNKLTVSVRSGPSAVLRDSGEGS